LDRETMKDRAAKAQLPAEWREARALYPLYANLAKEFVIDAPACPDLEDQTEAPSEESVRQARQWLLDLDERIQVHQLRQFLQTSSLASEPGLRDLLSHHLAKKHTEADRDKIDFLFVQYFAHCAPSGLQDENVDLACVAQVLEPVLGTVERKAPKWLASVDQLLAEANATKDLNRLLGAHILDKGRQLKESLGKEYFSPMAIVTFTRFGFLMRRIFFRLMYQDLHGIVEGLRELERNGVTTLDCRRAQFSAEEPISRLRMICQSWKVLFHAEYSSGQPLRMLVDLRAVVDGALARAAKTVAPPRPAGPLKQAAAAGVGAGSDASEFEVLPSPPDSGE
jgi:hypothetical protein